MDRVAGLSHQGGIGSEGMIIGVQNLTQMTFCSWAARYARQSSEQLEDGPACHGVGVRGSRLGFPHLRGAPLPVGETWGIFWQMWGAK